MQRIKIENTVIGSVRILTVADKTGQGQYRYFCECICGNLFIAKGWDLRAQRVKSCGCLLKKVTADRNRQSKGKLRLDKGKPAVNALYGQYRKAATQAKRNFPFLLTLDEFESFLQQPCHYCGAKPSSTYTDGIGQHYPYNGIDRYDNTLGYVMENCVTCCRTCNRNKGPMSGSDFLDWIERIYRHRLNQ